MRKPTRILLAVALSLGVCAVALATDRQLDLKDVVVKLNGSPQPVTTLDAGTTSRCNATVLSGGGIYMVQPVPETEADFYAPIYVKQGATCPSFKPDAGVYVQGGEKYYMTLKTNEKYIGVVTADGGTQAHIYKME